MQKSFLYRIVGLSILLLMCICILIALVIIREEPEVVVKEPVFESFCGTQGTPPEAIMGKEIFNNNCAACHRINSKHDYLIGMNKRYPNEFLMSYINAEDSLIKVKNKVVIKLNRGWDNNGYNHKNNFTKAELKSILAYINYRHSN